MTNPYLRARTLSRQREARSESIGARLLRAVFIVGALAAVSVLVRATFLEFLDTGANATALRGLWLRGGLLVLSMVGFRVHSTVLRGRSREILALLPVEPRKVVAVDLLDVTRTAVAWVAAVGLLCLPVGQALGISVWAQGMAVVAGAAALSISWSAIALLGAISVAEDPAWAGLLDAVRGNNPRPQAAIIYALAPMVFLGGVVLDQAAAGAVGEAHIATLALPWVLGFASIPAIAPLADRVWFQATMVLEDIRARYAAVEDPEDAKRVYMDWTLRWLPDEVSRWAELDLRHGWRSHRGTLAFMWLGALFAFGAGWSAQAGTPMRAGLVAGVSGWWCGAVMLRMAAEVQPFLRTWLVVPRGVRLAARTWTVGMWSVAPIAAAGVAVLLRMGPMAAAQAMGIGMVVCALAALAAAVFAARPRLGMVPYVALGTLVVAITARVMESVT